MQPSGAASAGIHAIKAGATALKVVKAVDKGNDIIKSANKAYKFVSKISDIKKATGS